MSTDLPPFTDPDWLLIGMPHKDGHMVMASTRLGWIELRREYRSLADAFDHRNETSSILSATIRNWVFAFGATYAEAIANLMAMWSPDGGTELPAGTLGLPSPGASPLQITEEEPG